MKFSIAAAAWLLVACRPHGEPKNLEFPPAVGPPLGLEYIQCGSAALALLQVPGLRQENHALRLDDKNRGYELAIGTDDGKTGDVEIRMRSCAGLSERLDSLWGPGKTSAVETQSVLETQWSSEASPWVASLRGCILTFTSVRCFGAPGTVVGATPQTALGMVISDAPPEVRRIANAQLPYSHVLFGAPESIGVDKDSRRIVSVDLALPPRVVTALMRAWGPGVPIEASERKVGWTNDDAATFATLIVRPEFSTLHIAAFVPIARWLGGGSELAVLPSDLWIRTIDELERLHPELHLDLQQPYTLLEAPPTESSWGPVWITLKTDPVRRVSSARISLPIRDADEATAMGLVQEKWALSPAADGALVSPDDRVRVRRSMGSLAIEIGRPSI